MTCEDGKIGPLRQPSNISDCAVTNDANRSPPPQLSAQDLADHRRFGVAVSRDDQDLALANLINGKENGPEVGRFAQCGDGASEQPRLQAGGGAEV